MRIKVFLLSFILIFTIIFGGCGQKNENEIGTNTSKATSSVDLSFLGSEEDMFTDRDYDASYTEKVDIVLDGNSASCNSDKVKIEGSKVTITDEGTYVISGSLDDGMLVVDAEETDKPQLVFNNVVIESSNSAALYVIESDKVFVTLEKNSTNALSNGGTFEAIDENNIDGTIFSKQDIVFNGSGSLTVESPSGHGIVAKDDMKITSGTYTINSASHGIDANDSLRVADGTIAINAGKDAIHVENTDDESLGYIYVIGGMFEIDSQGDGISAGTTMQIEGGSFDITSGGGSVNGTKKTSDSFGMHPQRGNMGMMRVEDTSDDGTSIKAIKSSGSMYINNVNFVADSADDAIHSNASIVIDGGEYNLATGDDGIHADETLAIVDGQIKIVESYEGIEGLNIEIYDGTIDVIASDDGINAAGGMDQSGMGGTRGKETFGDAMGSIQIKGSKIYMNASGDGIDSNGSLDITGGYIEVCGPTQGDTAVLDYDTTGTINGGTFVGTGAYMMAQTLDSTEQGVLAVNVGSQSAGSTIEIKDSDGKVLKSFAPKLSYQILIFSSPEIVKGQNYTISVGSVSGDIQAY